MLEGDALLVALVYLQQLSPFLKRLFSRRNKFYRDKFKKSNGRVKIGIS